MYKIRERMSLKQKEKKYISQMFSHPTPFLNPSFKTFHNELLVIKIDHLHDKGVVK